MKDEREWCAVMDPRPEGAAVNSQRRKPWSNTAASVLRSPEGAAVNSQGRQPLGMRIIERCLSPQGAAGGPQGQGCL